MTVLTISGHRFFSRLILLIVVFVRSPVKSADADGSHDSDHMTWIRLDRAGMLGPIGIALSELYIVSLLYIENNQTTYTSQL